MRVTGGEVIVTLNDTERLRVPSTLPPEVLIGFSAGTGGQTNTHWVRGVTVTVR